MLRGRKIIGNDKSQQSLMGRLGRQASSLSMLASHYRDESRWVEEDSLERLSYFGSFTILGRIAIFGFVCGGDDLIPITLVCCMGSLDFFESAGVGLDAGRGAGL